MGINECPYCHKRAFPFGKYFFPGIQQCQNCGESVKFFEGWFFAGLVLVTAIFVVASDYIFPKNLMWLGFPIFYTFVHFLRAFIPLSKVRAKENQ